MLPSYMGRNNAFAFLYLLVFTVFMFFIAPPLVSAGCAVPDFTIYDCAPDPSCAPGEMNCTPKAGTGVTAIDPPQCDPDEVYIAMFDACFDVEEAMDQLVTLLIIAGALVAVYRTVIGFFMFLTAQGDPSKLQAGREALTQAIVGLIIVVAGYAFLTFFDAFIPQQWQIFNIGP